MFSNQTYLCNILRTIETKITGDVDSHWNSYHDFPSVISEYAHISHRNFAIKILADLHPSK